MPAQGKPYEATAASPFSAFSLCAQRAGAGRAAHHHYRQRRPCHAQRRRLRRRAAVACAAVGHRDRPAPAQGRRHLQPGRHHAPGRRLHRRLQRTGLLEPGGGARLHARQPLQLPPRRAADQRRNRHRPGQQAAPRGAQGHERLASRHQLARRPAEPGGQASRATACATPACRGRRTPRWRRLSTSATAAMPSAGASTPAARGSTRSCAPAAASAGWQLPRSTRVWARRRWRKWSSK